MSHPEQVNFCVGVKRLHPRWFQDVNVLDIGSLDINGSNRPLFEKSQYLGIDLAAGKNVDLVGRAGEMPFANGCFDTIISTECFEHDEDWERTLVNAMRMLKPGGLFLFTCATTGRGEHGTAQTAPDNSPFTNSYYRNLTVTDFDPYLQMVNPRTYRVVGQDLQFFGFKIQ